MRKSKTKKEEVNVEIPLYLNQKIVFDWLASINDGIAQVTKMTEMSGIEKNAEGKLESELGNKNIFALLGVKLKGDIANTSFNKQEKEKVHTPSSLFNRLKNTLLQEGLVKRVNDSIEDIKVGDIVEFEGEIRVNPIIKVLENTKSMMQLATTINNNTGQKAKKENAENKAMIEQMDAIINKLQENNMFDLICENNISAVLPVYKDYFFNNNLGEVIEGTFKVIGKVTKVCDTGEISLLRNTGFTMLNKEVLDSIFDIFNSESELNIDTVERTVSAPALLILPIAIYL